MMCFLEMHSLKASQNILAPYLFTKNYRGLTVAPHGDGFFLKESRIQEIVFGVGQMPALPSHLVLFAGSATTNHENISLDIPQTIYLPILQSQHFFHQGAFEFADLYIIYFLQQENKPILFLPLFLNETRIDCWSHKLLYLTTTCQD